MLGPSASGELTNSENNEQRSADGVGRERSLLSIVQHPGGHLVGRLVGDDRRTILSFQAASTPVGQTLMRPVHRPAVIGGAGLGVVCGVTASTAAGITRSRRP
jgi:hypothetical protein